MICIVLRVVERLLCGRLSKSIEDDSNGIE